MDHHPSAAPGAQAEPASLSEHLARSATRLAGAIALCHKERGGWVAWTWRDWHAEVARVAAALAGRGFRPGDVVAIAAGPSPQALAVTLAAQALGGAAMWVDPERAQPAPTTWPAIPETRFGFARDEAALSRLRARLGLTDPWTLGLHTADHGSPDDAGATIRTYAAAAAVSGDPSDEPLRWARASDVAFFVPPDPAVDGRALSPAGLTHAALIDAGQAWLAAAGDATQGLAFTAEAPATPAIAAFFAGWLVGGFPLGLPEDATTANTDRRQLQPRIVAATGAAYGQLARQVADDLPPPDTFLRRAVDAGLASPARWGAWVVRRPLREVLGLRRAEAALVLGVPAPPAAEALFAALGIPLRALSFAARAAATPQATRPDDAPTVPTVSSPVSPGPALARSAATAGEFG